MIAALFPLPPVIDQTIHRAPLDWWSGLGFVGVVAASAFLGYRRSSLLLAALALGIPFAGYRDLANTTITLEKCLLFGATVGLLLSGVPVMPVSPAARRVFAAGALLLIAIALSAWHAPFPIHVAREFFKQAEYLVLLWCGVTLIEQTVNGDRALTAGVAVAAAIVTSLAILQGVFGGAPSGIWINGHPVPRVAGTLEGPNQLAGYLEAALPLLWVTPLLLGRLPTAVALVCSASCAALVLTQSRAGILVAALAYAGFAKMRAQIARSFLPWVLCGSIVGLAVIGGWLFFWAHADLADIERLMRLTSLQPPGGVGTRGELWHAAWALFRSHPLTGVGAGNYELLLGSVGLHGIQTQAGSWWLQTLAEQGIVGFAALVFFAVTALRATYALRRESPLALAAFLAFASLLAHQLVDDLFFFPKAAELAWLMLGAGVAATSLRNGVQTPLEVTVEPQPPRSQPAVPEPT